MLLSIVWISLAQAAPPKADTYFASNDQYLTIKKADDKELTFDLEGANSYSGNTSTLGGVAARKGDAWEYHDKDDKTCVVRLRPLDAKSIRVTLDDCHGLWIDGGDYKLRDKDCGKGFDKRNKEIGALSKAKKFAEALKRAEALAKDCLETLDENGRGELHSDLAFLAYKTGNKERCRKEVSAGIDALGAAHGLKELKESLEYYQVEDENGKMSCKQATQGGCWIYEERIKVYKHLEHNRKLCSR